MNRRTFMKRSGGVAMAGGMVALAGCQDAAPEDMRATANLSIEAEGGSAYAEVTGKVWPSNTDGEKYAPEKITLLVRLLQDGSVVESTTKDIPMDLKDEIEYTVSFALDSDMASKPLSADATVTAVWHDGEKTTAKSTPGSEF